MCPLGGRGAQQPFTFPSGRPSDWPKQEFREIRREICYAVHFPPAETRSVGREGHRTGPYRTEDGEKNEIQTPEIAIFLRKLSISTKAVTSMIESISRISKLGSILRFF